MHLQVSVRDNGTVPFQASTTQLVYITDVNDEAPVFAPGIGKQLARHESLRVPLLYFQSP